MSTKTVPTKTVSKSASTKSVVAEAPKVTKKVVKAKEEVKEVAKEVKPKAPRAKKAPVATSDTSSAVVSKLAASVVGASEVEGEKVRRVVNNEEIEKSFDEMYASVEKELQALRDDKTHSVGIRFLRSLCRQVKSLKADCFRLLSRKVRKPSTRNGNSGFMKSVKISPEMAKFCGFKSDQLVSRVDVTKAICN